ncbi:MULTISPECIES: response regulator [Cupriavidus]
MRKSPPAAALFCFLVLFLVSAARGAGVAAAAAPAPALAPQIEVFGRLTSAPKPWLSQDDREWLAHRAPLTVGVVTPDYPPLEVFGGGRVEGVTADYLALMFDPLPRVRAFTSRQAALEALRRGEIDLLGRGSAAEAADYDLRVSHIYLADQPVLISADSRRFDDQREGATLALVAGYLAERQLAARYPKSRILLFTSPQRALEALSLGHVDGMIGDALSTHYLINMNYLLNLRIENFAPIDSHGFGFLVRAEDNRLRALIDRALVQINVQFGDEILRSWSAGRRFRLDEQRLALTPAENRWLAAHAEVPVIVNRYLGSLAQLDARGRVTGIGHDYLELIAQRSGLKFTYTSADNFAELSKRMDAGEAMVTPVLPPDNPSDGKLEILSPYLRSSVILMTRQDREGVSDLASLAGKRLATSPGYYLNDTIRRDYPAIDLQVYDNLLEAMRSVDEDKSDACISNLFSGRFLVAHNFNGRLVVSGILEDRTVPVSIGVLRSEPELQNILEKAQMSIGPDEVADIVRQWEPRFPAVGASFWRDHRGRIVQLGGIFALAVALSLVWAFYLARQVRKTRRAEKRLTNQLALKNTLVSAIPNPVYLLDRDGGLSACNPALLRLFGASAEQSLGKTILDLHWFPAELAQRLLREQRQRMAQGTPAVEEHLLDINGQVRYIQHWTVPYRDVDGEAGGMIGGWVDLTERQSLIGQLQVAREKAESANQAKSIFLSTMSHEIRTPMNAIIGLQELVLQKAGQGVVDTDSLAVAQEAARGLLLLLGNVLDLTRIETGKLDSSPEPVALRAQIEGIVTLVIGMARQKHLSLDLRLEGDVDQWVMMDPLHFKQVLFNLLSNAIKFTERGGVTLRATGRCAGERLRLLLEVIDTGIGISAQDQAKLFQPFSQVEAAQAGQAFGSGLGLSISLRLIELLGGSISLRSEPGHGSCFRVDLDLPLSAAPAAVPQSPAPAAAARNLDVLAVDDHPANRITFRQQLKHLGHRVTLASDGLQALELWQAGAFDVVLTDCQMPRMDGLELARRIRAEEGRGGRRRCLILAVTASAEPAEVERCLAAGMDRVLIKPLTLETVGQALAAVSA